MADRVVLVGMMGAGKSTVGPRVAERLGWDFVDLDAAIEQSTGRRLSEVFADVGEEEFRRIESAELARVLAGAGPLVLSVGGGAVVDPANRRGLASCVVVWLRAELDTLLERVGDGQGRPLLGEGSARPTLESLAAVRSELYSAVSAAAVDVDGLDPDQVAELVVGAARPLLAMAR